MQALGCVIGEDGGGFRGVIEDGEDTDDGKLVRAVRFRFRACPWGMLYVMYMMYNVMYQRSSVMISKNI